MLATVFFQASPLLLNSSAVAKMHMGEYQEAETILVEVSDDRHKACIHTVHLLECLLLESVSGVMSVLATTFFLSHVQCPFRRSRHVTV